jgi:HEAT repeats
MSASIRRVIAGIVLALAVSSAGAKPIPDLVRDLGSKQHGLRVAAYRALVALRNPAVVGPLAAALPGYDTLGRTYAQIILDALPHARTRGVFRSLLRSDDPELRVLGAVSLNKKGDPSGLVIAAKALRNTLYKDAVTYGIMVRLVYVRHRLITEAVRERLRLKATAAMVRCMMLHVNYVADAEAVPALRVLTSSEDLEVRIRARALIYRFGQLVDVTGLAAELANPKVSYVALSDVLTWMKYGPKPPQALAKALLTRLEGEGQPLTVSRIFDTLAAWRYRPAIEFAKPFVDDPDIRVARAAFGLIAKLVGRPQLDALRRSLESKTPTIRVLAAEALRKYDDQSGLVVVIAVLGGDDVEGRREAARVLGGYRMREAIAPLIDALEDADQTARTHAWTGLARMLPSLFPYRRFDLAALGYAANSPAAARADAVAVLRAWWAARPR